MKLGIISGLALAIVAISAAAAPVTLEFEGLVQSSTVPSAVGTTFTGYVTYDEANSMERGGTGLSYHGTSIYGCDAHINGACSRDNGTGLPVVTDYQVDWSKGVEKPWAYSLDFKDSSDRWNRSDVSSSTNLTLQELWTLSRNQTHTETQGDVAGGNFTSIATRRQFYFLVSSQNDELIPGAFEDLAQAFYIDRQTGFFFGHTDFIVFAESSTTTCVGGDCTTVQNLNNYRFDGRLKIIRVRSAVMAVSIDISPTSSADNVVDFKRDKFLDVAVLGSTEFDVVQLDPATVRFGSNGATPLRSKYRDINGDGLSDSVFTFILDETGIACGDTSASLTGTTYPDPVVEIQGADSFTTTNCP